METPNEYDYKPTMLDIVMEWIWSVYPQLYNEREEHLPEIRDIVMNYLIERDATDIDAYSASLQKMLEKRYYFLGD